MKLTKLFAVLFVLVMFTACTPNGNALNGETLAFPDTQWNMTVGEVRAALDISEEEWPNQSTISEDGELVDRYSYELSGRQVLGHDAEISFRFWDIRETGHLGLYAVLVYFTDGTSADTLLAELNDQLGEGAVQDGARVWNSTRTTEKEMRQTAEVIGDNYTGTPEEMAEILADSQDSPFAQLWFAENAAETDAFTENKLYYLPDAPACPALLFDGFNGVSMVHSLAHYQELFG